MKDPAIGDDREPAREATVSTVPQPERRKLIATVATLVGAAVGSAATGRDVLASPGTAVLADCPNQVTGTTALDRTAVVQTDEPTLKVDTGGSAAVEGKSALGAGVVGLSGVSALDPVATFTATLRRSRAGGVLGSDDGAGVVAVNTPSDVGGDAIADAGSTPSGMVGLAMGPLPGVVGFSSVAGGNPTSLRGLVSDLGNGVGVIGLQGAADGIGVATGTMYLSAGVSGVSVDESGVRGTGISASGVGVSAAHAGGGTALRVEGVAEFATVGHGTILPKSNFHDVEDTRTTALSHVLVTFRSQTKKLFVSWVEMKPGVGFRLHLSKKQRFSTEFTYVIFEGTP